MTRIKCLTAFDSRQFFCENFSLLVLMVFNYWRQMTIALNHIDFRIRADIIALYI